MKISKYCQEQFDFELPNITLARLTNNFLVRLSRCDNSAITRSSATAEIARDADVGAHSLSL